VISKPPSERGLAAVVIGGAVVAFVVAVVVGGPSFRSFDEAKYLGIGYSMVQGHGPRTIFGVLFLPHSPLWPVLIAAPDVWFGIDPFAWGHLLNAIAAVALLAMIGWHVYLTGPNTSVPSLLASLTPEHGFTPVAQREFPSRTSSGADSSAVHIYAVDPARVDFSGAGLAAPPEALTQFVRLLSTDPATSPTTARALIDRATTWPDPAAAGPILDRLRPLAGR